MKTTMYMMMTVLVLMAAGTLSAQTTAEPQPAARPLAGQGRGAGCPNFVELNKKSLNKKN